MNYEVSVERRRRFIHVTVRGENRPNVVSRYLRDIVEECRRQDCYRVLIEEKLQGPRLGAGDVFEIASEGATEALGVLQAVAYVDEKMGDMAEFAETVAINRGMPVKTFASVADAEEWLDSQIEGPDEQHIFTGEEGPEDGGPERS